MPWLRRRAVVVAGAVLLVAATAGGIAWMVRDYRQKKAWAQLQKKLPPSGGRFLSRKLVIEVPTFRQSDARWADDRLGPSSDTLAAPSSARVGGKWGEGRWLPLPREWERVGVRAR
jgi:hypothetical protein